METLTNIKVGDLTNKGIVKMVDNPWLDGNKPANRIVNTTGGIFRETELEIIEKAEKPKIDTKPEIDFMVTQSIDIRPGKVIAASRIAKTDKLIHLTIKTNLGTKSVVTNLGEFYEPVDFIGSTFMFIMNLKPVKLGGKLSEAMILAEDDFRFDEKNNEWVKFVKLIKVS
jgi:methionine--tRNA ligase beta chain